MMWVFLSAVRSDRAVNSAADVLICAACMRVCVCVCWVGVGGVGGWVGGLGVGAISTWQESAGNANAAHNVRCRSSHLLTSVAVRRRPASITQPGGKATLPTACQPMLAVQIMAASMIEDEVVKSKVGAGTAGQAAGWKTQGLPCSQAPI